MTKLSLTIKKRKRGVAAAFAALLLAVLLAAPLTALGDEHGRVEPVFGAVVETGDGTVTVARDAGGVITLRVTEDTRLRIDGQSGSLQEVFPGDSIGGTMMPAASEGEDPEAVSLLVHPTGSGPSYMHVVGIVTSVDDGAAVLVDQDGNTLRVALPAGRDAPEIGDVITAVTRRHPQGTIVARDIEPAQSVISRLTEAFERVNQALERSPEDSEAREALEELRDRLSATGNLHLGLIDQAMAAGGEAAEELRQKLAETREEYRQLAEHAGADEPLMAASGVVRESGPETLVISLSNGAELRLSVPDGARATLLDGDSIPVQELPSGMHVQVEYEAGDHTRAVRGVRQATQAAAGQAGPALYLDDETRRNFIGVIEGVHETNRVNEAVAVVTLSLGEGDARRVVKVAYSTDIAVDGNIASVSRLSRGQSAVVSLDERAVAARISAFSPTPGARALGGVLHGVDAEDRSITIETARQRSLQLDVPEDAPVLRDDEAVDLSDAQPGDLVLPESRYTPGDGEVIALSLKSRQGLTLSGVVAGVNSRADSLTILSASGERVSLRITDDTEIVSLGGEPVAPIRINPGYRLMEGEYRIEETDGVEVNVASRLVIEPPTVVQSTGTVTRVSPAFETITVRAADGRELVLSVPGSGNVALTRNGAPIDDVEEIEAGDEARPVVFQPNGVVLRLSLFTPGARRFRGVVTSVSASEGALSVAVRGDEPLSLHVPKDARLVRNGRAVSLEAFAEGDRVVEAWHIPDEDPPVLLGLEALNKPGPAAQDVSGERERGPGESGREAPDAQRPGEGPPENRGRPDVDLPDPARGGPRG